MSGRSSAVRACRAMPRSLRAADERHRIPSRGDVRRTARCGAHAREWFVQPLRRVAGPARPGVRARRVERRSGSRSSTSWPRSSSRCPTSPGDHSRRSSRTSSLAGVYVLVAGTIGIVHAWRRLHPVVVMIRPGGQPTEEDQRKVLAAPRRIFLFQALLLGRRLAGRSSATTPATRGSSPSPSSSSSALAGWTTSSLTYLARGAVAAAGGPAGCSRRASPSAATCRSVASRAMFAWALGTGFAVLGIVFAASSALVDPQNGTTHAARAHHDRPRRHHDPGRRVLVVRRRAGEQRADPQPARGLRPGRAGRLRRRGADLRRHRDRHAPGGVQPDARTGCKEREELRDLFGRHVGADVARSALEKGVRLGGESRDVAVLFVDIIGSTTLAEDRPPEEVVALLNRFFEVVIDVVHEHDGWINKFEGDAALAVWGAPVDMDDKQTSALRAARVMGRRLAEEVPEIKAGIGVSCGTAVAGNVGTAERYEYTVIGDPVNEAARLTGLAKKVPARVVASHGARRVRRRRGGRALGGARARSPCAARAGRPGSPRRRRLTPAGSSAVRWSRPAGRARRAGARPPASTTRPRRGWRRRCRRGCRCRPRPGRRRRRTWRRA